MICLRSWLVLLIAGCGMAAAQAELTITGTRVVYEDAQGESSVRVRHSAGDTPVLMQAWLDDGDPRSEPGTQDVPFLMNPSVAYMAPGAEQVIRILRVGDLPTDRETLLFFNVLEVRPDAVDAIGVDGGSVHFNMQVRLKFFYRPKGLRMRLDQAVESLRFLAEPPGDDGVLRLRVDNPTPYHVTFNALTLHASDAADAPALAALDPAHEFGSMVVPHGTMTVYLKAPGGGTTHLPAQAQVRYTYVNDQGGYVTLKSRLE